jgi:hypothetical protein
VHEHDNCSMCATDNNVNASSILHNNSSALKELNFPIFSDNSNQIVGNVLKDLDLYFELKGVPENLKLYLASRAIQDPFARGWLNAEY